MEKEIVLITSYLDKLGEKLGIGANMLWPYIMKQTLLYGIMNIVVLTVLGLVIAYLFKTIQGHSTYDSNDWADALCVRVGVTVAVGILLGIALLRFVMEGFYELFNTEYIAFETLVKMLRRL